MYEGVSKSSWNHPEVKEPETSFWYVVQKTSLHCKVTHFSHYLLTIHRPKLYNIGHKSAILRFDQNWLFLWICIEWQIMISSYVPG